LPILHHVADDDAPAARLARRQPARPLLVRPLRPNKTVAYSCVMPTKPDPAEIGDVEPVADSTARQARRVVAAYATDADECRVFLSMLGIGPSKLDA
jgi:hypothetical protein